MIQSSGKKEATGVVCEVPCNLWGFTWAADASQKPTLTLNDHASAGSGTVLAFVAANDATTSVVMFPAPVRCFNGIYATFSGAHGDAVVYYEVL